MISPKDVNLLGHSFKVVQDQLPVRQHGLQKPNAFGRWILLWISVNGSVELMCFSVHTSELVGSECCLCPYCVLSNTCFCLVAGQMSSFWTLLKCLSIYRHPRTTCCQVVITCVLRLWWLSGGQGTIQVGLILSIGWSWYLFNGHDARAPVNDLPIDCKPLCFDHDVGSFNEMIARHTMMHALSCSPS